MSKYAEEPEMTPYPSGSKIVGVVLLLVGLFCSIAEAASGDADGIYTVTIKKLEFRNATTGDFITVFEGSRAINIAAASAGATAASLLSGGGVPQGTYNQVRVTMDATLTVKGYVNNGATTIYTDGGTDTEAFTTNGAAANTPGADYATSTFTIPAAFRTATDPVSFTIGAVAPTVRVTFDTSGVVTQSGGIPSLGAPSVTITAV